MKFMKKFYLALLLVLPVAAFGVLTSEQEFRLNRMNQLAADVQLGTLLAKTPNLVVGKYSYGTSGQTATSGDVSLLRTIGDSASTITIPDNAVVQNVWVDVLTAPTGTSVALKLVSAGDLLAETAAGDLTAGLYQGIPDYATIADQIKLSADKTLKATLNGTASAGKFNVYVEYVLGD